IKPMNATVDLPLHVQTPDRWAAQVLAHPLALLNDHAYLEKKAASNALELLNRWPEPKAPRGWATTLAGIARDEASHLAAVCRLLHQRGGKLERVHKNPYANALRSLVRKGQGRKEIVDRLLISALIEARSCERFEVLARALTDEGLAALYLGLFTSEMKHYRVFVRLAGDI